MKIYVALTILQSYHILEALQAKSLTAPNHDKRMNPIDFGGQRSRSYTNIWARGDALLCIVLVVFWTVMYWI